MARRNIPCKRYNYKTISRSVMASKVYSVAVVGVEAFDRLPVTYLR
jgi:hypothetical protein